MNHLCRITLPQWTPSCIKGRRIFDEIEIHKIRAYNTNSYHLQHPEANTYLQLSNKQHILFTWRTQIPSNTPYIPQIINQTPTPIHAWRQDLASSIHLLPSPRHNFCFLKLHNDRLFILWKYLTKVTQASTWDTMPISARKQTKHSSTSSITLTSFDHVSHESRKYLCQFLQLTPKWTHHLPKLFDKLPFTKRLHTHPQCWS